MKKIVLPPRRGEFLFLSPLLFQNSLSLPLSLTVGPARAAVLGDVLIAHGRERDGPGPPVVGGREVLGRDGREGERGLAVGKEREKAREGKRRMSRSSLLLVGLN